MRTINQTRDVMDEQDAIREGLDEATCVTRTKIGNILKMSADDIDFTALAQEATLANIHSDDPELLAFLKEQGLAGVPHVLMADHSFGGRDFTSKSRPPYFPDQDMDRGGWDVLAEENALRLWWQSATSGSELTAKKTGRRWSLSLQVPIRDGEPYQGQYWDIFHKVVEASGSFAIEE